MGYSCKKSKQPFEVKLRKIPKNCILAFQNPNDTLRHSIPYCYLLEYCLLFLISLVKKDSGNDAFSKQTKILNGT
jgi:hypothetical protein